MEIDLQAIAAGSFILGREGVVLSESVVPVNLTISRGFLISRFLITQSQWFDLMGSRPWEVFKKRSEYREGDNYPAVGVSWHDATQFALALSQKSGRSYLLPSEAQWEYSIRAGTSTKYFWGEELGNVEEFAWCYQRDKDDIYELHLHEVGKLKPNPMGLYDMAGNVMEWVRDSYEREKNSPYIRKGFYPKVATDWVGSKGEFRMLRNASFCGPASCASSYWKIIEDPTYKSVEVGFRVVCEQQ